MGDTDYPRQFMINYHGAVDCGFNEAAIVGDAPRGLVVLDPVSGSEQDTSVTTFVDDIGKTTYHPDPRELPSHVAAMGAGLEEALDDRGYALNAQKG